MNLKTISVTIHPCQVCDYPFSDRHHIWPQSKGGKTLDTIWLCPNHHRFANLVQAMVMQQMIDEEIKRFAANHFDAAFNSSVLEFLIAQQRRLSVQGWKKYYVVMLREALARNDRAEMKAIMLAMLPIMFRCENPIEILEASKTLDPSEFDSSVQRVMRHLLPYADRAQAIIKEANS